MDEVKDNIEEWRPITGYPGYEVSSLGRVFSQFIHRARKHKIDKDGYPSLYLNRPDGPPKYFHIHVLVCLAFNGPKPSPTHQVNHMDGVKTNNIPDNLEWVTVSENYRHARDMGLVSKIEKSGYAYGKLTEIDVLAIRDALNKNPTFAEIRQIAVNYGINWRHIYRIRDKSRWAHL